MIKLIAFAAVALAVTTSVQALPVAPVHEPDAMITQVAYGCGPFRNEFMVSAWPEPPFARHAAIIADVHDGMEALACATITTERRFSAQFV